tara:strand:+ start:176 stop:505 length:330 start_codon:yes stop_codon:yes gene_type:complete
MTDARGYKTIGQRLHEKCSVFDAQGKDRYLQGANDAKVFVMELLQEVKEVYQQQVDQAVEGKKHDEWAEKEFSQLDVARGQLNAVAYSMAEVVNGGFINEDGERVCLPW